MIQLTPSVDTSPFKDLQSHLEHIVRAGGQRAESLEALAMGTYHYCRTDLGLDYVRHCMSWILTNSLTLWTPTYDSLGIVLDPLLSKVNHSCDPNIITVFNGASIYLRALKPIAAGEEIFMSYIDPTYPSRVRQSELSKRFHFDCMCEKCRLGSFADTDQYLEDPEKLPKDWFTARNTPLLPQNITLQYSKEKFSSHRKGIEFLEDSAKSQLDTLDKDFVISKGHIFTYASLLVGLQASRLFPCNHQPLPAIFHALYLSRLKQDFFVEAFRFGLYLALQVHPRIYPQEFHPVRVTHLWGLVMIANHLLMLPAKAAAQMTLTEEEEEDVAHAKELHRMGVHMGTTAQILAHDVVNQVEKSHGLENRFTATVLRIVGHMEEMQKRRFSDSNRIDIQHAKEWLASEMRAKKPGAEDVEKNRIGMKTVAEDAGDLNPIINKIRGGELGEDVDLANWKVRMMMVDPMS
ncbi:MAG: hypothetical protein M1831_000627 [Alyxoria varia]|nr:MAG: hypothetical protein M1831_000627 [Alyxoria varia]